MPGKLNLSEIYNDASSGAGTTLLEAGGYVNPMFSAFAGGLAPSKTVVEQTASLQAAIDFAVAEGYSGVLVPRFGSLFTHVAELDIKTDLFGFGPGSRLQVDDKAYITNQTDVALSRFRFQAMQRYRALLVSGGGGLRFDGMRFLDETADASGSHLTLYVENADDVEVVGCRFLGGGLWVTGTAGLRVLGSRINVNGATDTDCIKLSQGTDGLIVGNWLLNASRDGVDIYTSGERVVLSDNQIINPEIHGIEAKVILNDPPYIGGSSDQDGYVESVVITNNLIRNMDGGLVDQVAGIFNSFEDNRASPPAFDQGQTPRCFIVTSNILENIDAACGIITDAHNSIYSNNIIRNVTAGGSATGGKGIWAQSDSDSLIISHNVVSCDGPGIIADDGTNLIITENLIQQDRVTGVTPTIGLQGTFTDCELDGNRVAAVSVSSVNLNLIRSSLDRNKLAGRAFINQMTESSFSDNIVDGLSGGHVVNAGNGGADCIGNRLNGNLIKNPGGTNRGLYVRRLKGSTILGTRVRGAAGTALYAGTGTTECIIKDLIRQTGIGNGLIWQTAGDAATNRLADVDVIALA